MDIPSEYPGAFSTAGIAQQLESLASSLRLKEQKAKSAWAQVSEVAKNAEAPSPMIAEIREKVEAWTCIGPNPTNEYADGYFYALKKVLELLEPKKPKPKPTKFMPGDWLTNDLLIGQGYAYLITRVVGDAIYAFSYRYSVASSNWEFAVTTKNLRLATGAEVERALSAYCA